MEKYFRGVTQYSNRIGFAIDNSKQPMDGQRWLSQTLKARESQRLADAVYDKSIWGMFYPRNQLLEPLVGSTRLPSFKK